MKQTAILFKFFFTFFFFSLTTIAFSQEDQTAELEVRLYPVITFTLNDANPTLVFDEADDFINGTTYVANDAAVVTASAPFSVEVKADKMHLRDASNNKIKVTSIFLEASGDNLGDTPRISLRPNKQDIITSAPAAISKMINFTYSTEGNDDEFIGKPAGDYTVELVFTAALD